jgi:hypothetical protein
VRVDQIVRRHLGDGARVIVPRTAREFIIPGTLPYGAMVDATEDSTAVSAAEQGDVVLLALGDNRATDFLELLPADSIAVLVLTVPPEKLPVGAVLEALHASRAQVLDAVAVQHSKPAVAVVAGRPNSVMLPAAYLSRDVGETDQDGALRRIVGEWVLESFVRRAETHLAEADAKRSAEERSNLQQTVAARNETIDRLNNELAANQSRLAERQRRVEALEGSRSVRVGRTVSRLLRHVRWWRHVRNPTNSS